MKNTKPLRSVPLSAWVVIGLLSSSFAPGLSAADDPNAPNFLFIQADQFRYDLMQSVQEEMARYDGKTHVRTPNLDRLRNEGVYFRQAYTQCAVCAPARSTFRTGCTLERHGGQSNGLASESTYTKDPIFQNKIEAAVTFEQVLVENRGYVAEHYGKWHMPEIFNWSTNGSTRVMRYNDFDFVSNTPLFNNSKSSLDYDSKLASVAAGLDLTQYPGMQKNTYSQYPYVTDRIDKRYGLDPYSTLSGLQPDQQGRDTLPADRTPSYFEATATLAALDRLAGNAEPFVVTASFHNPHAPMIATGIYYDYYKELETNMFLPPNIDGDDMVNSAWSKHGDPDYQDPAKVKEWMVSYYALCEEVDHYVGLMLDKLDEKGLADNTFVIFVSDHGEMLGAHGMREKNVFLEESAHVPMLMRFPGRIEAGITVEETVSTLDCFATALDYLGASAYDRGDGRSLRRFIEKTNYNKDFDDEAIVTEWDFRDPDGSGGLLRTLGGESNFLCKKGPWKLILTKKASSTRLDMMYNLESDPYEMVNLVGNNGMTASDEAIGKAEHLKCLMVEWMQRMDDDGGMDYYSDPVWNAGEGLGDIAEITARRKWKTLDIWVSDTAVKVGLPVEVDGQLTRNEYIYMGRSEPGTLNISDISVQGADAGLIQLSEFTAGDITEGNFERVKLTYLPAYYGQQISDARVVIRNDAGPDKVIDLSSAIPPNSAPQITSRPALNVDATTTYTYILSATDPNGDAMTFSGETVPSWLNFNTNTAVLSGTPSVDDIGSHPVVLRVSDGQFSIDDAFTLVVSSPGNDAPVFDSVPVTRAIENQIYSYTVSAADADGDALTYSVSNKPSWLNFDAGTGILSGTPSSADAGLNPVVLAVSDENEIVIQSFNIAVFTTPVPANLIQNGSFETGDGTGWYLNEMSVSNAQATNGIYSLYVYGTGTDNVRGNPRPSPDPFLQPNTDYVVTYDINYVSGTGVCTIRLTNINKLKSSTRSPTSGWEPKTLPFNSGTNTTLRMELYCDGTPSADFVVYLDNFVLAEVGAVGNTAPVITSVPVTNVNAGAAYSCTLLAADAENDPLVFTGVDVPAWLSFNTTNGVLSGTPSSDDVGPHPVALRVSDGSGTGDQNFDIIVSAVGYIRWALENGVTGLMLDDDDADGVNNLYEYALGGNPTNGVSAEVVPMFGNINGSMLYIHLQRNDDPSLIYRVETSTNLLSNVWTNSGVSVLGTNLTDGVYNEVTNSIPTESDQSFVRMKVIHR